MKARVTFIVSVVLLCLKVSGQDWIGDQFTLDTIVPFHGVRTPENLNLIQCRMIDGTFYFVERQGFQNKENGYQAVVHTFSTENYEQSEIEQTNPEPNLPCGVNVSSPEPLHGIPAPEQGQLFRGGP